MWERNEDAHEPLSQGDLVVNLPFPKLELPLAEIARRPNKSRKREAVVDFLDKHASVVVTQSCQIDKPGNEYVALAPVRLSSAGSVQETNAVLVEEPPSQEGDSYVYDLFRIESFDPHLPVKEGLLYVADLGQTQTFSGQSELRSLRVARMSVEARRLLRLKLASFWGRVTSEDEEYFIKVGKPSGLTPP